MLNFSKADFEELCNHLLETDFSDCYSSVIVEDVWSTIKHAILYAMNLHIPMLKIKSHKHPKWYNSDIRHHLNCIRTLRKSCSFDVGHEMHLASHALHQNYNSETQLQHKMLAAKADFEEELILNSSSNNISCKGV